MVPLKAEDGKEQSTPPPPPHRNNICILADSCFLSLPGPFLNQKIFIITFRTIYLKPCSSCPFLTTSAFFFFFFFLKCIFFFLFFLFSPLSPTGLFYLSPSRWAESFWLCVCSKLFHSMSLFLDTSPCRHTHTETHPPTLIHSSVVLVTMG